jgi:hypothetical protein
MADLCPSCGSEELNDELVDPASGMLHWGKRVCARCGRHIKWLPKPDQLRTRRPARHRNLVDKYGRGFCELCLRWAKDLPPLEQLIGHHVNHPDAPTCAESDDPGRENVWILCTYCHALVGQQRTYLGHYKPIVRRAQSA